LLGNEQKQEPARLLRQSKREEEQLSFFSFLMNIGNRD